MNLYLHFPFCKGKCAYCALYSAVGKSASFLSSYASSLAREVDALPYSDFSTVYFGGGTPMMCDLTPVLSVLASRLSTDTEVTVETSPLFTDLDSLLRLRRAGVNRMSMGVQSFNDEVLLSMRRPHTAQEAKDAFRRIVQAGFSNAGIDLIAGWPGEGVDSWRKTLEEAIALEPAHLSVYSLILESGTLLNRRVKSGESVMATDDFTMDLLALAEEILASNGYVRYEISSYCRRGFECRHNLATWRGEDYVGLGAGAHGRLGLLRTRGERLSEEFSVTGNIYSEEKLESREDAMERALFALRLKEGFSPAETVAKWPALSGELERWTRVLAEQERNGFVRSVEGRYVLTPRGREVCDSVLVEFL